MGQKYTQIAVIHGALDIDNAAQPLWRFDEGRCWREEKSEDDPRAQLCRSSCAIPVQVINVAKKDGKMYRASTNRFAVA